MRLLLTTLAIATLQAACAGGSWGIGFDDATTPSAVAGATATVNGTFDTSGGYNGKYTIIATPNGGADICEVAANGGPAASTIPVDTSSGDQTVKLVVTMNVSATATVDADCKVVATSDDDPSRHQGADADVILGQ